MDQDMLVSHRKVGLDDEVIQMVTLSREGNTSSSKVDEEKTLPTPVTSVFALEATEDTERHDTRTVTQERAERIQLLALFFFAGLLGWNDGSNGPLIPRIQEAYNVKTFKSLN